MTARVAALVALLLLHGCTQPENPSSSWPPLGVYVRLSDMLAERVPAELATGRLVLLAGESRRTVSSTLAAPLPAGSWSADGDRPGRWVYRTAVPPELRKARALLLTPTPTDPQLGIALAPTIVRPSVDDPIVSFSAGPPAVRDGRPVDVSVTARIVPELADRDVVTVPLAIPRGAVLQVAIGVEESAWPLETGPLVFRVIAIDADRETVLHEKTLDPTGRPLDRGWIEERVDLDRLGGHLVRLKLAVRPAGDDATTSLPLWADPVVLAPRQGAGPAFGVVLISLDTLRARSVSAYGAPRPTTPTLDAFAASGVLFSDASAPAPHTLTSHLSLFTGLYLRPHHVEGVPVLKTSVATLPQILRRVGYDTAAFTEDGFVDPFYGFARGFSVYSEDKSADFHAPEGHAARTFARGTAWLRTHHEWPFFLFLHTYQVHFPYDPPAGYENVLAPADSIPPGAERDLLRYEQEIRYTDDVLAKFLGELDRLGLGARTLVVVISDHGEEFLEHGLRYHGADLYDEVIRVPFVMRLPGMLPRGGRVAAPVSLVDVLPTILDLLGVPPEPGLDGRSLLPLVRGEDGAAAGAVYSAPGVGFAAISAVRTATHTCIVPRKDAACECYDRRTDPFEKTPLPADDASPGALSARKQLDAFRAEEANDESSTVGVTSTPMPDAERLEKLRALGYVQ